MTNSDVVFLPPPKPHPLAALVRRPAFWVWVLILALRFGSRPTASASTTRI